jgi:integrase
MPITLRESRHSGATWLDAAGVPPKIASVLMGHATPARQPGAAPITLARYTHALPEDIEGARERLAAYLAEHEQAKATGG